MKTQGIQRIISSTLTENVMTKNAIPEHKKGWYTDKFVLNLTYGYIFTH